MNLAPYISVTQVQPQCSHINVGYGSDVTISGLAAMGACVTGYPGRVTFDARKPEGVPRKWMDSGRLCAAGSSAKVGLEHGLFQACQDMFA